MSAEELAALAALFGGPVRMVGRKVAVPVGLFTSGEVLISPEHARALLAEPDPWGER